MDTYFKKYHEKLLKQLSVDLNCNTTDFYAGENVITASVLNDGREATVRGSHFWRWLRLEETRLLLQM